MTTFKFASLTLLAAAVTLFTACEKDESTSETAQGRIEVQFTDAPSDDSNIEAVFVTVSEVKVDGEVVGDASATFDISSYTGMDAYTYQANSVDAGVYADLEVTFDAAADANGNAPGAYVLMKDGTKKALEFSGGSTATVRQTVNTQVQSNMTSTLVMDLDLRKAVQREGDDDYTFGSAAEFAASTRVVNRAMTAAIEGQITNSDQYANGQVVVYAYNKGMYNMSESSAEFESAVTSTAANASGEFTLGFLPAGEYDVVVAYYEEDPTTNQMVFSGTFSTSLTSLISFTSVQVEAEANTSLTLSLGSLF